MTYIGYIIKNNEPVAITYGSEEDMLAWKQINLSINNTTQLFFEKDTLTWKQINLPINNTTQLFLLPDGEDPNRCLVDSKYFQSLLNL